jgi:hypothetical protein
MRATILSLLDANKTRAFVQFLRNYRKRKLEDVKVPASPEEALKVGYDMGYQHGYGNGLREGVDLGVDVGMGAVATGASGTPFDPGSLM